MITTPNFIITLIKEEDLFTVFKKHSIRLEEIPSSHTIFYLVTDLGLKGSKFVAQFSPEDNFLKLKAICNYDVPSNNLVEILQSLRALHPAIKLPFTLQSFPGPSAPNLEAILNRNEKLEALLASFNWLKSAHLLFYRDRFAFTNQEPTFRNIVYHCNPTTYINPNQKALFVEYEIYEHHLYLIRDLALNLSKQTSGILSYINFNYSKAEGLT